MKPILFDFFGLSLESYPFFMGLAWGTSYYIASWLLGRERKGEIALGSTYLGVFLASFFGAKLFFLITNPNHLKYFNQLSFWTGGGFVFYGGAIFAAVFLYLWSCRFKKFPFEKLFMLVATVPFAHAIGRIGCLLAGCCYGSQCELPWSIHLHGLNRHPVQLYESILLVGLGFILLRGILQKNWSNKIVISIYLASYSVIRFCLEFFRGDEVRGVFGGLSSSQWISLLIILLVIWKNYSPKMANR